MTGFVIGLFLGGTAMTLIVGAMASGAIDGLIADAFEAGRRAGQPRPKSETYTVPPVTWEDLEPDEPDYDWSRP